MADIALIYAPADAEAPAARLRSLLTTLGHRVVEDGSASTALLLLTPAVNADPAVIGRLQQPPPPIPLPVRDASSFPSAVDLADLLPRLASSATGGSQYVVITNHGAVGDHATVINHAGPPLSPAQYTALIAALHRRGADAPLSPHELRSTLTRIQQGIDAVEGQLDAIHRDLVERLAFLDDGQRHVVRILLNRLDAQEARTLDAIYEVVDTNAVAADELDRQLILIQDLLTRLQETQLEDRHLADAVGSIGDIVSAPGLDIKHKIKVSAPIIPVFLHYEGEVELGSGVNLEEIWRALQRWVSRIK